MMLTRAADEQVEPDDMMELFQTELGEDLRAAREAAREAIAAVRAHRAAPAPAPAPALPPEPEAEPQAGPSGTADHEEEAGNSKLREVGLSGRAEEMAGPLLNEAYLEANRRLREARQARLASSSALQGPGAAAAADPAPAPDDAPPTCTAGQ
eukprot:tig00020710_g13301.t1